MSSTKKMTITFSTTRMISALVADLTDKERAEAEGMGNPSLAVSVFGQPFGLVWEKSWDNNS